MTTAVCCASFTTGTQVPDGLAELSGRKVPNLSRTLRMMADYGLVSLQRNVRDVQPTALAIEFLVVLIDGHGHEGSLPMSQEGQLLDKKSLRAVLGKTVDWGELVKDCVAFANATGGRLLIGIETTRICRLQVSKCRLTCRTHCGASWRAHGQCGGTTQHRDRHQWRPIHRSDRPARLCCRIDHRRSLLPARRRPEQAGYRRRGDAFGNPRSALPWETQTTLNIPRAERDDVKLHRCWKACAHPTVSKRPSRKRMTKNCSITTSLHKAST